MDTLTLPIRQALTQGPVQRSPEWLALRSGRICASEAASLWSEPRSKADKEAGKFGETAYKYLRRLAFERVMGHTLTKQRRPDPKPWEKDAMEWGATLESDARLALQEVIAADIHEHTCIVDNSTTGYLLSSPDGYYYQDGKLHVVELKCPYTCESYEQALWYKTVDDVLDGGETHKKYVYQTEFNAYAIGADVCVLAFYDPRLHEHGYGLNYVSWKPDHGRTESILLRAVAQLKQYQEEILAKATRLTLPAPVLF